MESTEWVQKETRTTRLLKALVAAIVWGTSFGIGDLLFDSSASPAFVAFVTAGVATYTMTRR